MLKETVFSVKLEADLRDAFMAEAETTHTGLPPGWCASSCVKFVQRQCEA
jgi:hypothetical protein